MAQTPEYAMAEMLLQSHVEAIQLLPATPAAWFVEGFFKGLKAGTGLQGMINGKRVRWLVV